VSITLDFNTLSSILAQSSINSSFTLACLLFSSCTNSLAIFSISSIDLQPRKFFSALSYVSLKPSSCPDLSFKSLANFPLYLSKAEFVFSVGVDSLQCELSPPFTLFIKEVENCLLLPR